MPHPTETPYRTSAAPLAKKRAPGELVYSSADVGRRGPFTVVMFRLISVPAGVAVVLSATAGPTAGLLGLGGAVAASIWWWRRAAHSEGVVLRVDGNELEVRTANKKTVKGFFTLDDLDVVMDTKTIRKVQDGRDAIPALRFNGAVGPEIDTARVVLTSERERLALTDDFVSHTNAIEWFGKIRVFLRKQGWVPADERVPTDGADPGGG